MARTSTNTIKETANKALNGGSSDREEIEAQLEALKTEVANLTKTLASASSHQVENVKNKAVDLAENLASVSSDKLEVLKQDVSALQDTLEQQVRNKPYQSLGIALGVGVLAALLVRR